MIDKDFESLRKECLIDLNEHIVIADPINIFDFFKPDQLLKNKSKFGDWVVSKKGDMTYKKGRYFIDYYRLYDDNDDWIEHMSHKTWIDMFDFIPAYLQALKNAGLQHIINKLTLLP